jgi:hypothetical protein
LATLKPAAEPNSKAAQQALVVASWTNGWKSGSGVEAAVEQHLDADED